MEFELENYCERDKFASRSYAAIHNVSESMNLWGSAKVDIKILGYINLQGRYLDKVFEYSK